MLSKGSKVQDGSCYWRLPSARRQGSTRRNQGFRPHSASYLHEGVGTDFAADFVRALEEEFLSVPKSAKPTDLDRIVIGHSSGGPAVFLMLSACPRYFRHVITPAVCDAPVRRLMEQDYPGNAKSSDLDEFDTACMFKRVWNSEPDSKSDPDCYYDDFYQLLQAHAEPMTNEVHKQLGLVKTHGGNRLSRSHLKRHANTLLHTPWRRRPR